MRCRLLACVALVATVAACGVPDETSSGGGSSTTNPAWTQTDIAGADLDGDGRIDVVTIAALKQSSGVLNGTLTIYRQTALGAAIDMPVPMSRINAADVNGDGLVDLLLLGDSNRAYVMFQSATLRGTFAAPRQL